MKKTEKKRKRKKKPPVESTQVALAFFLVEVALAVSDD
jgi:hypothetical protein